MITDYDYQWGLSKFLNKINREEKDKDTIDDDLRTYFYDRYEHIKKKFKFEGDKKEFKRRYNKYLNKMYRTYLFNKNKKEKVQRRNIKLWAPLKELKGHDMEDCYIETKETEVEVSYTGLSSQQLDIVCLKAAGCSYKDISKIRKLTEANVRQIFNRAKKVIMKNAEGK